MPVFVVLEFIPVVDMVLARRGPVVILGFAEHYTVAVNTHVGFGLRPRTVVRWEDFNPPVEVVDAGRKWTRMVVGEHPVSVRNEVVGRLLAALS